MISIQTESIILATRCRFQSKTVTFHSLTTRQNKSLLIVSLKMMKIKIIIKINTNISILFLSLLLNNCICM